jgi:hypothetical protein
MDVLELQLEEGRTVPMHIRRRGLQPSLHTDRNLTELHGWITTTDADTHRWLSMALRRIGEQPVRALDAEGDPAGKWQLSWNSYGESVGIHTYAVILRESEELALEALLLDGLELHPYEYREEVVADGLAIWAKMVGEREYVSRLGEIIRRRESFPVIRRGIQDRPRDMRLELAEWSEYEDRVKYRIVLLERSIEAGPRAQLLTLEEERNRAALAYYANLVERLAALLVSRGVLSPQELAAARAAAHETPTVERQDAWHVADVDAL